MATPPTATPEFNPPPIPPARPGPPWLKAVGASLAFAILSRLQTGEDIGWIFIPGELVGRAAVAWLIGLVATVVGLVVTRGRGSSQQLLTRSVIIISGLLAVVTMAGILIQLINGPSRIDTGRNAENGDAITAEYVQFLAESLRLVTPFEIDTGVNVEAVEAEGMTLFLTARILGASPGSAADFVGGISANVIGTIFCTAPEMQSAIDGGMNIVVSYIVDDNSEVASALVSREGCAALKARQAAPTED